MFESEKKEWSLNFYRNRCTNLKKKKIYWHFGVRINTVKHAGLEVREHWKRIGLEDKAKVCLGDRILAALAVLPRSIWNKRLSLTNYSKLTGWVQPCVPNRPAEFNRLLAWQGFCPPKRRDDLCFVFYVIQSFFYAWEHALGSPKFWKFHWKLQASLVSPKSPSWSKNRGPCMDKKVCQACVWVDVYDTILTQRAHSLPTVTPAEYSRGWPVHTAPQDLCASFSRPSMHNGDAPFSILLACAKKGGGWGGGMDRVMTGLWR